MTSNRNAEQRETEKRGAVRYEDLELRPDEYDLFWPRDEFDQWTDPESVRGHALTAMDKTAGTVALIYAQVQRMPWYRRWPARVLIGVVMLWTRVTRSWR